jgi:hypothetical protein
MPDLGGERIASGDEFAGPNFRRFARSTTPEMEEAELPDEDLRADRIRREKTEEMREERG